jgi:dolichol kinase
VVRNLLYKKRTKAWQGSVAMLAVCIPVGALMGVAGIVAGIAATAVERIEGIDDNLSVPLVSLCILLPAYLLHVTLPIP